AKVGIPSFMTTLGTQFFWAGMATLLSGGKSYALRGAEESSVWQWIVGRPFASVASVPWLQEVSIQALWTALIVGFLWLILTRHRFGEHTLFIGDSNDVSRVVGIDVDREKIKIFTLMGFLAACAAIILTLENKNFFGNQGQGYLLTAIASVLIGGTSIFGGRATIVGTVFGCFIIGMIEAGLVAAGLTGAWVRTVQGLIFLIAIVFYMYVDEPQRRQAFLARLGSFGKFGGTRDVPQTMVETPSSRATKIKCEGCGATYTLGVDAICISGSELAGLLGGVVFGSTGAAKEFMDQKLMIGRTSNPDSDMLQRDRDTILRSGPRGWTCGECTRDNPWKPFET
ncbi:MAG: ABC transporter permease, partial [Planctomycetaceae bacterium]|nr:ABC transporter permease [Planctomycetaceae bacterium]